MAAILNLTTGVVYLVGAIGAISESNDGLGTTSTDGFALVNNTASTVGTTVQISPRLRFTGTAWNSVGVISEVDSWIIENLPVTAAGTTNSILKFGSSLAGGAYTYPATLTSAGQLTVTNIGAQRFIGAGTRLTTGFGTGIIKIVDATEALGVSLDAGTDGTLKLRGVAGTAATGNFDLGAKLTVYNNQTTAGWGLPAILGETILTSQSTNQTVLTVTPAATAARYKIDGVITSTSGTNTGTVQFTVDYVDSQGTVHTGDIIFIAGANAAGAATQTGASKEWHMVPWEITTNNAGTNIIIKTVITGTVAYTAAASVERVG